MKPWVCLEPAFTINPRRKSKLSQEQLSRCNARKSVSVSCEGKTPYLLRLVFSTLSGPTLPQWNVLPDSPPRSWEDKQDRFCSHPSESPHVRSAGRCWLWKQRCRIPKEHINRVKWILHLFGNFYQRERESSSSMALPSEWPKLAVHWE